MEILYPYFLAGRSIERQGVGISFSSVFAGLFDLSDQLFRLLWQIKDNISKVYVLVFLSCQRRFGFSKTILKPFEVTQNNGT